MSDLANWQPSASIANLLKRAKIVAEIRRFFTERGVLEVDTPAMSRATGTDLHLVPFETRYVGPGAAEGATLYMMTSPEFHMKRLLAAGSGPIYQLGKSFRNEEAGRHHNPEFTMLEWYRPHFDMYRLMNEVDDLLQQVLNCEASEVVSYQQIFQRHLEIDPLSADKPQLRAAAAKIELGSWRKKKRIAIPSYRCCLSLALSRTLVMKSRPLFTTSPPLRRLWRKSALKITAWRSALRSIIRALSWRTASAN